MNRGLFLSENDVVRTSPYVFIENGLYKENNVADYANFTKAVAMAVDSVERDKYGLEIFYNNIKFLASKYGVSELSSLSTMTEEENSKYVMFTREVMHEFENCKDEYEYFFDTINSLMDTYSIERCEIPDPNKYGGRQLVRK